MVKNEGTWLKKLATQARIIEVQVNSSLIQVFFYLIGKGLKFIKSSSNFV